MHHYLASFLGCVIFSISGRFDIMEYMNPSYAIMGFINFVLYMRWFLTPVAYYTWGNLNHSLCGTDSDPLWYNFELGRWYYMWAELYLGIAAFLFIWINIIICYIVKKIFGLQIREKVQEKSY